MRKEFFFYYSFGSVTLFSYIWDMESTEERKYKGRMKGKKIWWKIKIRFKLNKLILYIYSNSFIYFSLLNKD